MAGLRRAAKDGQLAFCGEGLPLADPQVFAAFVHTSFREDWVVYAKPPFGGPEHVLQYLARYTHRVAISNHRIVAVTNSHVTFRWKDYAHHSRQRTMTLTGEGVIWKLCLYDSHRRRCGNVGMWESGAVGRISKRGGKREKLAS